MSRGVESPTSFSQSSFKVFGWEQRESTAQTYQQANRHVSLSLCLSQCHLPFMRILQSLRNVKALTALCRAKDPPTSPALPLPMKHCLGSALIPMEHGKGSLCERSQVVAGMGRLTAREKMSWLKELKFFKGKPKDRERVQPLF